MKKQLTTTLAAAIAFGTIAPVFANEINNFSLQSDEEVDIRLANGKEIYKKGDKQVFKRYEIFNYNGATSDQTEKHTLKSEYKDLEILVEKKDSKDRNEDLFVLCKKSNDSVGVATNKAKYDAIKSEIKSLLDNGYQMIKSSTNATISYEDGYKTGTEVIKLVKANEETKTITFNNVDILEEVVTDKVEILRDEVFKSTIEKINTLLGDTVSYNKENHLISINFKDDLKSNENAYKATNLLKYTIENNKDKFDISVDESGANNTGKLVKLYVKGLDKEDKNIVMSIDFANVSKIDKNKIVDMPIIKDSDFDGHWAKEEIVDAMLNGYVDASSEFRPKDSVTRAEFSKMVCTLFGIDIENLEGKTEPFHDVNSDAWYYKYITALYNEGEKGLIIDGYEDSTFKPNDSITREEASKIIAIAYSVKGGVLPLKEVNVNGEAKLESTTEKTVGLVDKTEIVNGKTIHLDSKTSFKDDSEIKAWADASVENLKELKIVKGYSDETFKPENTITRVEALLMLTRGNDLLN